MSETRLFQTELSWKFCDERLRLSGRKSVQRFLDFCDRRELVESAGAIADFSGGLRTTQNENAKRSHLGT